MWRSSDELAFETSPAPERRSSSRAADAVRDDDSPHQKRRVRRSSSRKQVEASPPGADPPRDEARRASRDWLGANMGGGTPSPPEQKVEVDDAKPHAAPVSSTSIKLSPRAVTIEGRGKHMHSRTDSEGSTPRSPPSRLSVGLKAPAHSKFKTAEQAITWTQAHWRGYKARTSGLYLQRRMHIGYEVRIFELRRDRSKLIVDFIGHIIFLCLLIGVFFMQHGRTVNDRNALVTTIKVRSPRSRRPPCLPLPSTYTLATPHCSLSLPAQPRTRSKAWRRTTA